MLVFKQLFGQLSGQLVTIRPLSDELLALSQSDRFWKSYLTLVARSVNGSRLFACVNRLTHWLLCITIFDCPRLHQAIICWVYRAIVRGFGPLVSRSVGDLIDWPIVGSIGWLLWLVLTLTSTLTSWCFQYRFCNHSSRRFKTESFSWTITHPHWASIRITCTYRGII